MWPLKTGYWFPVFLCVKKKKFVMWVIMMVKTFFFKGWKNFLVILHKWWFEMESWFGYLCVPLSDWEIPWAWIYVVPIKFNDPNEINMTFQFWKKFKRKSCSPLVIFPESDFSISASHSHFSIISNFQSSQRFSKRNNLQTCLTLYMGKYYRNSRKTITWISQTLNVPSVEQEQRRGNSVDSGENSIIRFFFMKFG